ncbi:hypothetical protein [Streptomonospora wellingtoniae]|uniref:DUF4373 domain-containing protein n=1 Tax=Streptomonospora wellingtoniae TaxID=3075544 RepID=A0ABU2KUF7_9ACTN|nr:hypothetical protein [Streptomonospora sp. DSM 45055]MDT0302935.1 hypothetical protein [Streptomonospora sp. DSM 45055]
MAWVRLSDDFYDHPKFDKAGSLGIALFAAGLAWCNRNLTDGFIPRKTALRLLDFEDVVEAVRNADRNAVTNVTDNAALTPAIARNTVQLLVDTGLWHEVEGGYEVHDYLDYQGSREQIEAGRENNAARQKAWRERRKAEREAKKKAGDNGNRNAVTNASRNGTVTGAPNPNPNPTEEVLRTSSDDVGDSTGESNGVTDKTAVRDDVERLCAHLQKRVTDNGKPAHLVTITKRWRDAARLMLDRDGRTEDQIHTAIDWCQDDTFWMANVQAMPTLREKYDTLRLQAQRDQGRHLQAVSGGYQPFQNPTDPNAYTEEW